ncbi:hypothetical protein KOR34_21120 [Posidoniimonas corsicana]|uniref:Uncharacterized protein n=1 Tax=Posidoniimonas corsicana TaxID=1938618 RepID=A0A5C5VHE8_9BACT|nr:hypothetical protein KOR34_21120 [Posidoniimonas corsicana]
MAGETSRNLTPDAMLSLADSSGCSCSSRSNCPGCLTLDILEGNQAARVAIHQGRGSRVCERVLLGNPTTTLKGERTLKNKLDLSCEEPYALCTKSRLRRQQKNEVFSSFQHRRRNARDTRAGIGKLELLLVLAILSLMLQLFPSLWGSFLFAIDTRNWSRSAWLLLNGLIILGLVGIRLGPELVAGWRAQPRSKRIRRRKRPLAMRVRRGDWKDLDDKSQRELFERMQEARKKQTI